MVAEEICQELQVRYETLKLALAPYGKDDLTCRWERRDLSEQFVIHGVGSITALQTVASRAQRKNIMMEALKASGCPSLYDLEAFWQDYHVDHHRAILQVCRQNGLPAVFASLVLSCLGRCESQCARFLFGSTEQTDAASLKHMAAALACNMETQKQMRRRCLSDSVGCGIDELPQRYSSYLDGPFDLTHDYSVPEACDIYFSYCCASMFRNKNRPASGPRFDSPL